jgi:hypothetical protein
MCEPRPLVFRNGMVVKNHASSGLLPAQQADRSVAASETANTARLIANFTMRAAETLLGFPIFTDRTRSPAIPSANSPPVKRSPLVSRVVLQIIEDLFERDEFREVLDVQFDPEIFFDRGNHVTLATESHPSVFETPACAMESTGSEGDRREASHHAIARVIHALPPKPGGRS